jgi:hypothetical protein
MTARLTPAYALVTLAWSLLVLAGCPRADLHQTLKRNQFQAPGGSPVMLAAYQPWFGRPGHINVGYSTQDPVVLSNQIEQAKELGIAGFVVNWYGPRKEFEDRSYLLLQQTAAKGDFRVALMYDEVTDRPQNATEDALADLRYAYENYIGPNAPARDAYLHYQGRPVVFIFPKGLNTDWKRVREYLDTWAERPLLIYKYPSDRGAEPFDGFYAWVHPGKDGWRPDGSNWGRAYLENFYSEMSAKHEDKIAVGAAWPGFDDSRASWSRNRRMDPRCGKTFADSLRLFRRYYSDERPLPFLMIVTWNDYEEGTAIERGLQKC